MLLLLLVARLAVVRTTFWSLILYRAVGPRPVISIIWWFISLLGAHYPVTLSVMAWGLFALLPSASPSSPPVPPTGL